MTTAAAGDQREPELLGQTVVVIGCSGPRPRSTRSRPRPSTATDPAALDRFFQGLPEQIDHVMVTGPAPYYAPLADLDRERAHRDFDAHLWLAIAVAQHAVGRVR